MDCTRAEAGLDHRENRFGVGLSGGEAVVLDLPAIRGRLFIYAPMEEAVRQVEGLDGHPPK